MKVIGFSATCKEAAVAVKIKSLGEVILTDDFVIAHEAIMRLAARRRKNFFINVMRCLVSVPPCRKIQKNKVWAGLVYLSEEALAKSEVLWKETIHIPVSNKAVTIQIQIMDALFLLRSKLSDFLKKIY